MTSPGSAARFDFNYIYNAQRFDLDNLEALPPALTPLQPDKPLTIKFIVSDLDGTMMQSYIALEATRLVWQHYEAELTPRRSEGDLRSVQDVMNEIYDYFRNHVKTENLLHDPAATLQQVASAIMLDNDQSGLLWSIVNRDEVRREIEIIFDQSADLFPGVREVLQLARASGTPFVIYTNTAPDHAVNRIAKSGIDPELITAICARMPGSDRHTWEIDTRDPVKMALASRVLIYKKAKPNPAPIINVAGIFGVQPSEILMIGESVSDLKSARPDPDHPICHFAYQAEGDRLISAEQVWVNKTLRPQSHTIGAEHTEMEGRISQIRDTLVTMEKGFWTLLEMAKASSLLLGRPPQWRRIHNWLPPQRTPGTYHPRPAIAFMAA